MEQRISERLLGGAVSALSAAALSAAYLFGFCWIRYPEQDFTVGFGGIVFRSLISFGKKNLTGTPLTYGQVVALATGFLLLLVYPSDVFKWKINGKESNYWKWFMIGLLFLLCVASISLLTYMFIFAPYLAYLALAIASFALLKVSLLKNVSNESYFLGILFGLGVSFVIFLVLWTLSLTMGSGYSIAASRDLRLDYHYEVNCTYEGNTTVEALRANSAWEIPPCKEAYMVFVAPFTFLAGAFVFFGVIYFLYKADKNKNEDEVKLEPLAQIFIGLVILSIFGLWIASSISMATREVADNVLWISFSILISLFVVWIAVFDVQRMLEQLKNTSLGQKGAEFLSNDWGVGLLFFSSLPVIVVFLLLDYVKQFIRRKTKISSASESNTEKDEKLTRFARKQISRYVDREYGSVITKSLIWGIFYFTMSVGVTRVTIVFLSALQGWLDKLSLAATSAALIAVGLLLFLLPPIPGVPVYITLGVVLPDKAVQSGINFWWGILYGIALSFALKILALVVQQKIIGEFWGSNSVWVREFVQINSTEIKATRKILSKPGLHLSKIVILTGGPDWPTSVLTGIMRLNVFQMILGTIPVIILITPTVFSGAMIVRQSENEIFAVLSTVSIIVTVIVQSTALLWSFQAIAAESVAHEDELKNMDPDQVVLNREIEQAKKRKDYAMRTSWDEIGLFWRAGHIISLILMIASCYAFLFFSTQLFVPFKVQDKIEKKLEGNALNLVKRPLGWIFLTMFFIACFYLLVFTLVFKFNQYKSNMEENELEEDSLDALSRDEGNSADIDSKE